MESVAKHLSLFAALLTYLTLLPAIAQPVLHLQPAYSENRISENANRCLFEDSRGYIWVGTIDGLNRYDGRRFHIYQNDPRDTNSISGNYITEIREDRHGNIWVGTDKGLNRYLPGIDGFYSSRQQKPGDTVSTSYTTGIVSDSDGRLWVSAYGGLARLDEQQARFTPIPVDTNGRPDAILHADVTGLSPAGNGHFWIGYQNGRISKYEAGKFQHFPGLEADHAITDLLEDATGKLWIGSSKGLYRLDLQRGQVRQYHEKKTWDIYPMDGETWFNISFEGIHRYDPRHDRLVSIPVLVSDQEVFGDIKAFFRDEAGIIWGSFHGLYKQDPYEKRFKPYRLGTADRTRFHEQFVSGIAEDERGNWVILTVNNGLYYFDQEQQKWWNHENHPHYNNEIAKHRGSKLCVSGHLAYVLTEKAIFAFNLTNGQLQRFENPSEIGFRNSMILTAPDQLWIGGKEIFRLNLKTGRFKRFNPPGFQDSNNDLTLFQDRKGLLWGVSQAYIYRFNEEKQRFERSFQIGRSKSEFDEAVIAVNRDALGRFWLGRRNGLECVDPNTGKLEHYSIADGLPNNTVNSILIDQHEQLWLATNNGLSRFNPTKGIFRNFDRHDGVQDEIFLSNACYQAPDGRLFFGGVNGFNVFHPDSLLGNNPNPPRLLITDLRLFNESVIPGPGSILDRPINESESIELSYRDAAISFELLALGYSQPQKNQYAYMIEGVDPDWNYTGSGRTASYTGLPRGEILTFKARAANHDGVWNEQPTTLRIYIHPPFWETTWFRLVLLGCLLGVIVFYYHWRVWKIRIRNRRLEKEVRRQTAEIEQQAADLQQANEELKAKAKLIKEKARQLDQLNKAQARFFTSLSHEFRTPLTLLLGNLDALIQSDEPEKEFDAISSSMQMSAQQLLRLINQLMDTAKLESGQYQLQVRVGSLAEEITRICSSFRVLAERKGLRLELDLDAEGLTSAWFDADILHKVFNNLLSNAVKFTERGVIKVKAQCCRQHDAGHRLLLQISDSGVGIAAAQLPFIFNRFFQAEGTPDARRKGTGIGLSLVKLLVALHRGSISVSSETGKGTVFSLQLPIDRAAFTAAESSEKQILPEPFTLAAVPQQNGQVEIPEAMSKETSAGNALVLVIDDNPEIRSFVSRQLGRQYRVIEAKDGAEGFDLAVREVPDVIVSDVVMPACNGFELCERLKSDQRTSHIPVILLTALAEEQKKLTGLQRGADAYLSKPFSRRELLLHIRNLIRSREKWRRRFLSEYTLERLPTGLSKLDEEFLTNLQQLIEAELTNEHFGIEQLAKTCGVSRTQLFRKLKSLTGMSASAFIRDYRLRKAYALLNEDQYTVSEVIHATGFNSRSHFYTAFKKKFGLAPTALKKV